jgi:osmoprotectant transport system permease protein
MPIVRNRVLLTLSCIGAAASLFAGFLTVAPNRLARGAAMPLWQGPALEAGAIMAGLAALGLLAFLGREKPRSFATLIVAALILWANFEGAGHFARLLAEDAPPAARFSLGASFWVLAAIALLAMLDAAQRAKFSLVLRLCLGAALAAGFAAMALAGDFDALSLAKEFASRRALFLAELGRHLFLVGAAIACALILGAPLTALALRRTGARGLVFASLGALQTIPSIALFGVLIAPLSALSAHLPFLRELGIGGTGAAPAIIALTLYSLLPLVRSSYTGFAEVAPGVKDAAAGMGLDARQMFFWIELPLALPALVSGLRVVAIQAIGLAAVAALIGAGGLGAFVFQGIGQYALDLVLVGAIPIILLALIADFAFQMLLAAARRGT